MFSNTATKSDHQRFEVLDGMRGIAALLVMVLHYNLYEDYGFFSKFFANIMTAVDFFFVLSGFVVSYAYADKLRGGLGATDYLSKRVARLYPLAVAGMALGLPAFYWGTVNAGASPYSVDFDAAGKTFGNMAAMLGSNLLLVPYLGTVNGAHVIFPFDGPLWSIFFEMFASAAFIWLVGRSSRALAWIACVFYIGLIITAALLADSGDINPNLGYRYENFVGGFPRVLCSFICGMLLYRLWKAKPVDGVLGAIQKPRIKNAGFLYIGFILMLCCPFYIKGLYRFFVILFAAPYMVVQGSQAQCRSAAMRRASWFLGWISYPVYCLHRPVGNEITLLHAQGFITTNLPLQAIAIPATLLTSVLVASAFDRLKVQQRLGGVLKAVMPQAAKSSPR